MESTDFTIFFDQVPEEGLGRQFKLSGGELGLLDLAVSLEGDLEARLLLTRLGRRLLVRGDVAGAMHLECSRCLDTFSFPFSSSFETSLEVGAPGAGEEEKELSKEDLDIQPLKGGAVDLGEIIAEQVHLAVPYKALCSESCKGMCSRCGARLAEGECSCRETGTDPRWDALKNLKVR